MNPTTPNNGAPQGAPALTDCTDCGEPLRQPIAFNKLSRLTQKYVCEDCYKEHNNQLREPQRLWAIQDDYI